MCRATPSRIGAGETVTPRFGTVVFPDFVFVNFEGGYEFYVVYVVSAEVHVHESWDGGVWFGVFVVLGSLDECAGAISYAYKRYADFWHSVNLLVREGLTSVCAITFS
jgi:hypothetical protein